MVLQNKTNRHHSVIQKRATVTGINRANTSELIQKQEISESQIFQYRSNKEARGEDMQYYNRAWDAMSSTKPLPKYKKKTCYNHKCKFLKQWVFDQPGQVNDSLKSDTVDMMGITLGRGTHDERL